MTGQSNVDRLRDAYAAWHKTKGGSQDTWLALFSEQLLIRSVGNEAAGLDFAGECCTRDEAVAYFTGLLQTWDMIYWTPEQFVVDGDRIAMFGRCAWRHKVTGKDMEVSVAHLWTFTKDGASELVEVFDSARAAAAAI